VAGPLRRLGRPTAGVYAGAWFVGLALVVAGPLLGRGHLILLDFPSGPEFPKLWLLPLPSSGDVGNTLPLTAVHVLFRELWGPLPEKLVLVLPIVIGGLGLYRLVRRALGVGALPAVVGGTLYVINPFVYDRYLSGHMSFLLGFALLPWAVLPLVRALDEPSRRTAFVVALWIGVLAAVSFHVAGLYAIFVLAVALFGLGRARARAAFALTAAGLGALLSAYWLLPLFLAPERRVGVADLGAYESRPHGFAVVPTLLALYGFWREEFIRPAEEQPALYLLLIPILALVAVGGVLLVRSTRDRRVGIALAVVGALGVFLAAGTALPPTAGAFRWLFTHVPFAGAYREPQKFLALTVLTYAVFAAIGLERLSRGRRWTLPAAPVAIAAILLYGNGLLWGLGGKVELSEYPPSWVQGNRVMKRNGDGRLIVLPWKLYEDWTFTGARIVANPAVSFFSGREVLTANDAGFANVPPESVDPFFYYVRDLLDRNDWRGLGRALALLGVRYVASTEEADTEDFQRLDGQPGDFKRIYFSPDATLAIFENRYWRGDVLPLRRIVERDPPTEPAGGAAVPVVRRLPGWKRIPPERSAAVSVDKRCNDGWRLGSARARCHLGAVAAFETPLKTEPLWRSFAAIQLLGYGISAVTLVFVLLSISRSQTTRAGLSPGPRITQRVT
jgi:hypothetical protein